MANDEILRAVIDAIIPSDDDPGALELGTAGFVAARLSALPADAAMIADGLRSLQSHAASATGLSFQSLGIERRYELLEAVETENWFIRLVTLTSEGFYADPGNGGNNGALSWRMIGYNHRLPEGPSGPPLLLRAAGQAR